MATTRLISMHENKGKSISQCLSNRINYATNPNKTNDGEFISAYACCPKTVQGEFMLTKRMYSDITGRNSRNNVIAYQIRQSFKPNEITPKLANEIGYKLGISFTKGEHAFVVATHTDKAHIHNHIIFNSTSLDCTRKFRDFLGSGKALAKISDKICLEYGLSVIENMKNTKNHYGKWLGNKKEMSHSDKLKIAINNALNKKPKDFDNFLEIMKKAGYEIKNHKHIAFKSAGQKRFIRLKSLGDEYSEEVIRAIIKGKTFARKKIVINSNQQGELNLLVDIQKRLQQGKGKGYERWAKTFNLKQMAKTINFLRDNNITNYDELEKKASEITHNFYTINTKIKSSEKRMKEIKTLQTHIINYLNTKEIYTAYRKAGYSKKFYTKYETQILIHKSSKEAFNRLKTNKLPTIKSLKDEYTRIFISKKNDYTIYKSVKKDMQDILIAKENVSNLLDMKDKKTTQKTLQNER